MPTTKRRRRHARNNEHQRQYFLYGDVFGATGNEPLFASPEEERRAWFSVRDEIMRECRQLGPGHRPQGYYRHELAIQQPRWRWYEQIETLLQRDLIDAAEAAAIETTYQILSPTQSDSFCSSFDNPTRIAEMRFDAYMRRSMSEEFGVVAQWHAWRNRPALAERYRRRAETVRGVGERTA